MSAIRTFIAKREKEIREQMRALRSELDELKAIKKGLEPLLIGVGNPAKPTRDQTIKDMVKAVLARKSDGMSAQEILRSIFEEFDVAIERTSLSPQLSRLRAEGDVFLNEGRWYPSQSFLAGWADAVSDDEFLELLNVPTETSTND